MNLEQLRKKRAQLLREAEGHRAADGTFADDQARTAFDAKMAEIDQIDGQIRTLEAQPAPTPAPTPAPAADPQAAAAAERSRVLGIQTAVRLANLAPAVADELVGQADMTLARAHGEIFRRLEAQQPPATVSRVAVVGEAERDKWIRGAAAWLFTRAGVIDMIAKRDGTTPDKIDPAEFRGLSLLDLARESLERAGVKTRGMDRMTLAGQAMAHRNYQSTSDFSTLLENVMHKILQAAYAVQPDTWSRWCGVGTVTDFRSHNFYRLGSLTELQDLNESGEFKNKAIPDAEKASYSAATKGNIIAITRQVIVNDDLNAVAGLVRALGRAGKLTIEKAAYAKLGENSGLGPTQSDSQPLFHAANRGNVGTGAALSAAALDADRVVMRSQTEPGGNDYLDLSPAVLLVPVGQGGQARIINDSPYDPDATANKAINRPNVAAKMFRDIVDTPRITGTRRYLFADPAVAPVILVSFLVGQREPVLETQDGWRVDGVELRARLDVGVDVVDYRGAVTNAGA